MVSVSMLTEGWDANTVTHVLGVRAFGTQLLCEQVIGRALRRQSYDLNEDGPNKGLFNVEYADVLGIPFDFTAKPVIAPPQPPRETIQVKAVRPDRDSLEIRFPRVAGYRREDAKEKKNTMEVYWVPGVNNLDSYGRWAFVEFTEVYQIESDFAKKIEDEFNKMIEGVLKGEE